MVDDDFWQLLVKRIRFSRAHEERVQGGEFEADDVLHPREGLGEVTRPGGHEAHRMRVLVDQGSNRVNVPRRDRLPVVNQYDVVRDAFDLVEDVGRHEHMTTVPRELRYGPEDVYAGQGIRAGQGLIEDQDLRIVGQGLGELRALTHPATVGPRGAVSDVR